LAVCGLAITSGGVAAIRAAPTAPHPLAARRCAPAAIYATSASIASKPQVENMLALFVASLLLASNADGDFVQTPGGLIHSTCIHTVANGGVVPANDSECLYPAPQKKKQIYSMDTHAQTTKAGGFTSFLANWTVPKNPTVAGGQVVYFWPGFKSQQPEMGLPVLQPVLQYGQGTPKWQLQSWFVNDKTGAPFYCANVIDVSPGDRITSSMLFDESSQEWTIR
jgi:hypothetical protein